MGIQGNTLNVDLLGIDKDLKDEEAFLPNSLDIRNYRISNAGNLIKRKGYAVKWSIPESSTVSLLASDKNNNIYAILGNGTIYNLFPTPIKTTGAIVKGNNRPQWINHQDFIIIVNGDTPIKIFGGIASDLLGSPPLAKFVDTLDTYVIMSGFNDTTFRWSALQNSESWPAANFNDVLGNGERIQHMKVYKRTIFFFKTKSIETWINVGGTTVFARQSLIERGCIAPYSVVQTNNTFYWFGDDGHIYTLNGLQPQRISTKYKRRLDDIKDKASVYGFDIEKEHVIIWVAPTDGITIVYDYLHNIILEDNEWLNGNWNRFPINSYLEKNNKQYFGDDKLTGNVYELSADNKTDNGIGIRAYRRFAGLLSSDGTISRVNRLRFRVKRGEGLSGSNAEFELRWRFDRGAWTNKQRLDLGNVGEYTPYVDIYSLGIGHEMEIEVSETDAVDFFITDMFITVEPLGFS